MTMEDSNKPLDVQQAVKSALFYVSSLYQSNNIQDILLEEVENIDDTWNITISFAKPAPTATPMNALAAIRALNQVPSNQSMERHYKLIKVDQNTGEIKSMKIRKV